VNAVGKPKIVARHGPASPSAKRRGDYIALK
jgi:hypothetical protein